MLTARNLTWWVLTGTFLATLIAGCSPTQQPQAGSPTTVPSALKEVPLLPAQPTSQDTPSPVTSTDGQPSPEQPNCKNPQTQGEINTCASESAKAADKQLNQAYQQLRSQLKDSQQEKLLIDGQRAWIQFRDADCAFEKSRFEGGSIAPSIYYSCLEQITKQRIEKLQDYLKPR